MYRSLDIICESVKKNRLCDIKDQTMESSLLFTFPRRLRHMYHIIICGLDVALLSSGLFLSPLCVPAIIAVGGCLSEERRVPRGEGGEVLSADILHGDLCVSVAGTCRQSVAARTERTRCEGPRAKNRRRTRRCCRRSSVNTCPLPLKPSVVFACARDVTSYIRAHVLSHR